MEKGKMTTFGLLRGVRIIATRYPMYWASVLAQIAVILREIDYSWAWLQSTKSLNHFRTHWASMKEI